MGKLSQAETGEILIMDENINRKDLPLSIEISDDDIYEAMKNIQGYLDITPADLKEIYKFAYRHAFERLTSSVKAGNIMTKTGILCKKNNAGERSC